MNHKKKIEQRLTSIEKQVAELRQSLSDKNDAPSWLDKVAGSFQDDTEFDEVLRLGQAIREADRPTDESQ
jgi:hypothetical protein